MNRTIIACASLLLLGACERSAKDDLTKAQEAQHQANEQAAKSQREADEKSAKAQKEADEKIQRANEEARKDQAKSQGNANEDIRTANQDLTKKRNDLQTKTFSFIDPYDEGLRLFRERYRFPSLETEC